MNDDLNILTLQYSSSTALTSDLIRRICHSQFSHVDMVLQGEGLLGASGEDVYPNFDDPGGVLIRPFDPWPYKIKQIVRIKTPKAEAVRERWRTQIGKPFDNGALYEFLSAKPGDRDWRDDGQWFCSEGIIWAAEAEAVFDWDLVVAQDRVSPPDSLNIFNPLIVTDDIVALRNLLRSTA